jgi:hypothetical protein
VCRKEPTRKRYFNEDELTSCAIKKSSKSRKMLTFFSDYGDLDAVFTKCSIKARRIDLELRFPPYDFMKRLSGDVWPQAYDADTFLECVKSRL